MCCWGLRRFAVWPKVRAFISSLPAGAVVADVGCGNGKYFGVRRDIFVLGSDRSQGRTGRKKLSVGPLGWPARLFCCGQWCLL